jgi:hypothetical protein
MVVKRFTYNFHFYAIQTIQNCHPRKTASALNCCTYSPAYLKARLSEERVDGKEDSSSVGIELMSTKRDLVWRGRSSRIAGHRGT